MSKRGSTSAWRRTPFTVQAMHPPKGLHLHSFDWIDTPARLLASRPDTANAWPVVVARLHMHLGPRRPRRPGFRRVGWAGQRRRVQRPADVAGIPSWPVTVRACLWRRYPPLPSIEVAIRARPSSVRAGFVPQRSHMDANDHERSSTVQRNRRSPASQLMQRAAAAASR
jgi:hypothetical protein